MSGNKEGALKARDTNIKKHGPDFYKKIGSESWKNPDRSRKTGFALNPSLAKEAGRKGGKKTKSEYKTKEEEWTTPEEIRQLIESEELGPTVSE